MSAASVGRSITQSIILGALAVTAACSGSGGAGTPVSVTGAGATFPYPVYSKWFDAFHTQTQTQINYQSVGSGAGVKQFVEGTVDFGATDGPMTDDEIAAIGGKVLHIPTVLGAVAFNEFDGVIQAPKPQHRARLENATLGQQRVGHVRLA